MTRSRKILISSLIIIFFLVIARLCLPYIVLYYVNKQINKIPEYKAKIADLDIALYRGSYTIKNIQLWKINHKIPVPFFSADIIDLSVQWKALLHGKFAAKIFIDHPVLNFVIDPKGHNEQISMNKIWIDIVKKLFPLNFNDITIQNGALSYRNLSGGIFFKLMLKNIQAHIQNIQNANKFTQLLPSAFDITAVSGEQGKVKITGKFNPFEKYPTFYLNGYLKNIDINLLRNFLMYYSGVNASQGSFSVYTEITGLHGNIKGYAKPFIYHLKITPPPQASLLKIIYNHAASLAAKVLENSNKKTVATQINFEGNIEDPNVSIWSIIFYSLRHAFIQAIIPQIDHSVKIQNMFEKDNIKYKK